VFDMLARGNVSERTDDKNISLANALNIVVGVLII